MMMRLGQHFTISILRSVLLVTFLFFSLVGLIEVVEVGNRAGSSVLENPIATLGPAFFSALKWALDLLPISFLVGAVLGLNELQNNREIIVAKASGVSIWGVALAPILGATLLGIIVSYVADPLVLLGNKKIQMLDKTEQGQTIFQTGNLKWVQQENQEGKFFLSAKSISEDGLQLKNVSIFQYDASNGISKQIHAEAAHFTQNNWLLKNGKSIESAANTVVFEQLSFPTNTSRQNVALQLGSVDQLSVGKLRAFLSTAKEVTKNTSAAAMRLRRMEALPALLVGSLLIAFAFTSGYRRHGTSGSQVLYGIVLGFVLYVVTKLLDRAGGAGSMDATVAAWGPAILAIVIGTSALLWKEDG